jgi:hypothetical protein
VQTAQAAKSWPGTVQVSTAFVQPAQMTAQNHYLCSAAAQIMDYLSALSLPNGDSGDVLLHSLHFALLVVAHPIMRDH